MYMQVTDGEKPSVTELLSRWIPRLSLLIGLCAFIFQVTVLYPWHLELSQDFAKLAVQVKNATK
jgi:hypothetical protein